MRLSQLTLLIENIAKDKGISIPKIVGGIPRDKILKAQNDFTDIDITTGDNTIYQLVKEVASTLKIPNSKHLTFPDKHSRLYIGDLKLDFSSNFRIPNIEKELQKIGIKNPTNTEMELYSRDFTCNTLLLSMDLKNIQDITEKAIPDIKNKIIKTCLDPSITLGLDNKRVVRVIYLAAKLNFDIDKNIIEWIRANPNSLSNVRHQYLVKKLAKAINYNKEKVQQLLTEMDLWKNTPNIKELNEYMIKNIKM